MRCLDISFAFDDDSLTTVALLGFRISMIILLV